VRKGAKVIVVRRGDLPADHVVVRLVPSDGLPKSLESRTIESERLKKL